MKKQILIVGIIVLLVCVGLSGCFEEKENIEVKDTALIQQLIDNAAPGETVRIPSGTYDASTSIIINKTLTLIGEDKNTTVITDTDILLIIDGADGVNISGFTFQMAIPSTPGANGIRLWDSNNCSIEDNIIKDNYCGIWLQFLSNNNTIKNNIFGRHSGYFIRIENGSSNNSIYHNNFLEDSYVRDHGTNNRWDNGYPSGGNYWTYDFHNRADEDGDGINDTPYLIVTGWIDGDPIFENQDRYPMMNPFDI